MSSHSIGSNCEEDISTGALENFHHFLSSETAVRPGSLTGSPCEELKETEANTTNTCTDANADNMLYSYINSYVAGFILKKISKTVTKCTDCKSACFAESNREEHAMIKARERCGAFASRLKYPSEKMSKTLFSIHEIIKQILQTECEKLNFVDSVKTKIVANVEFDWLHQAHKVEVSDLIIKFSIRTLVHSWCKEINNILSGKATPNEETCNFLKRMALDKYRKTLKHKN
ncbi:hypothetical protein QE152_g39681 [Popillia japonica]|uniref:Uncharacterized protein n=1 Tax=Popillia japonica TaxID=7064 RepID=A0AAW1HTL1_POPJA